jgi:hypothetical protein
MSNDVDRVSAVTQLTKYLSEPELAFENRKSSASEGYRELRSAFEVRKLLNRKIVEQGAKCAFAKRNLSAPSRSGVVAGMARALHADRPPHPEIDLQAQHRTHLFSMESLR